MRRYQSVKQTDVRLGRRSFILGVAAAIAAIAPSSVHSRQHQNADPAIQLDPIIDVHCHVFNASDLPIKGFVRRVALGDHEKTARLLPDGEAAEFGFLPSLAALLTDYLAGDAPLARDELAALDGAAFAALPQWPPDEAARNEKLAAAIQRHLLGVGAAFGATDGLDAAEEAGRNQLLRAMLSEAGVDADALAAGFIDFRQIGARLRSKGGRIGRLFRWADLLIAPRHLIVEEYARLYGGANGVALCTPALVDFSHWLESEPKSGFEDQVKVMSTIQRGVEGVRMHSFAPFDPWRDALASMNSSPRRTGLELVKWAINDMGFIGVKLYPPMGFFPSRNAERSLTAPKRAKDIPEFASRIDRSLEALYAWTEEEGVPVMAHATNSNEAGDGFGERARPSNWVDVATRYPRLSVNLGHFGGFDEANNDAIAGTWEADVGELRAAGHNNVFADLSYLSEALPGHLTKSERAQLVRKMKTYMSRFPSGHRTMMFGTDWLMLGQEKRHGAYLDAFLALLGDAGVNHDAKNNIMSRNAVRFLGLSPGMQTRRRLERWYRAEGLDAAWLSRFPST